MQNADAAFEDGGVKGIGLVGALQAFEEAGFEWKNVAGTSAGAITAALVAVGFSASEIKDIMQNRIAFRDFMDRSKLGRIPLVGRWISMVLQHGMYKGDYFLNLMRQLLSEKTGKDRVTFGDLVVPKEPGDSQDMYESTYKYKLRLVASDISGNKMLVLPQDIAELGMDPDELEVALAVRMSMSIPFIFRPVQFGMGEHRNRRHWIVDGGMLSNFPIWLFDSPPDDDPTWPTIGFLLWEPEAERSRYHRIRSFISMIPAIIQTLTGSIDRKSLEDAELSRVVKIPTGTVSTTDFDLTDEARDGLYNSGYDSAKAFLQTWDFNDYVTRRSRSSR